MVRRGFYLAYGFTVYAMFLVTILYAIGFGANMVVPKAIDDGEVVPIGEAVLVNVILLELFAVQHTIMARSEFKEWWTTIIPKPIERSTFIVFASAILLMTFWQWRPMPGLGDPERIKSVSTFAAGVVCRRSFPSAKKPFSRWRPRFS